ncbi:DUF423 domain-containing protein [Salibacter sp.]|uniref:DUF423 domain-containing protein n=1 Tax=Salibacter sp. TaxID=2010995 RepID=UPI002870AA17|nr:DUF423 domain-containing protein [Salibacter sp.]MDR9397864.1 DUF423 domain-containing protein [Salibacter sp.]MDR9486614.1 DUF423 domain-containing protein [Salibacter sp.]
MHSKTLIIAAGVSGAVAISLGAMGAHALSESLTPKNLDSFTTGNDYHIYHSIGFLALTGLRGKMGDGAIKTVFWFWLVGTILFSGSIYLLSIRNLVDTPELAMLGPITPIGGVSLIIGWAYLIIAPMRGKKKSKN